MYSPSLHIFFDLPFRDLKTESCMSWNAHIAQQMVPFFALRAPLPEYQPQDVQQHDHLVHPLGGRWCISLNTPSPFFPPIFGLLGLLAATRPLCRGGSRWGVWRSSLWQWAATLTRACVTHDEVGWGIRVEVDTLQRWAQSLTLNFQLVATDCDCWRVNLRSY